MFGKWPACARWVAAPLQPPVQLVQNRAAYLANLKVPDSGLDRPPDMPLAAFPRRQLPLGDRGLLIHQPRYGHVGLGLAAHRSLLEQLAERDLRGPLGPAGLPQPASGPRSTHGLSVCAGGAPGVEP